MKNKCKELERVAIGIALMFGVYWLYAYFLQGISPRYFPMDLV